MAISLAEIHIFEIIDLFFFILGAILTISLSKRPPKWLVDLLHAFKVVAGAAIITMLIFKISILDLIGTGIDIVLSIIAGSLLAAGILRTETNLL